MANWLPAPAEPFYLAMRIYGPEVSYEQSVGTFTSSKSGLKLEQGDNETLTIL
jgi:hypothetical protein